LPSLPHFALNTHLHHLCPLHAPKRVALHDL
jgi:hypothetical protein